MEKMEMSDSEWREKLGAERFAVLRQSATEPPFSGDLLHVDDKGVFHCAGCNAELFATDSKFDSGSGWPSFDRAIAAGSVLEKKDRSHFMSRTEILCAKCNGHLGHVFDDGPTETGQRFCVNSLSLNFEKDNSSDS